MNFTFIQMPFSDDYKSAVNKSDIPLTTQIYKSAVYFVSYAIQIVIWWDYERYGYCVLFWH